MDFECGFDFSDDLWQIAGILTKDLENVDFDFIQNTISKLTESESTKDDILIQLNEFARLSADKSYRHYEYNLLAGRIKTVCLRKTHKIKSKFSEAVESAKVLLDPKYYEYVMEYADILDIFIDHSRDFRKDYVAMNTLLKSYLLRIKKDGETYIQETPQYMYMRLAVFLWKNSATNRQEIELDIIKKIYDELSTECYTHASPTLFNSGTLKPQCGSCFLSSVEDNMESITESWIDSAYISQSAGGLGFSYSAIRHSEIANCGISDGLVPWLRIKNQILKGVNQMGRRKGSAAIYLEPWHVDIEEFLELRLNTGSEDMRARDLFYGLWIPDLFMERVRNGQDWSLFCPNIAKDAGFLYKCHGDVFEEKYLQYEKDGLATKTIPAQVLWQKILISQKETGMPYMCYKDAANRKSNQKNLGTIRCSNLCTEIMEFSGDDEMAIEYGHEKEIASCNLLSISLPACLDTNSKGNLFFSFEKLEKYVISAVRNLNQVIDRTYYNTRIPQIKRSNLLHRPLGIGVQGKANLFAELDYLWDSEDAILLNKKIAEAMYYYGMKENVEMAIEYGQYTSFKKSPTSKGLFTFDLWDIERRSKELKKPFEEVEKEFIANGFDFDNNNNVDIPNNKKVGNFWYDENISFVGKKFWNVLRTKMVKYGLRNSLLFAYMPTASSAQIIGNNEAFESFTSNIFARNLLSGTYLIVNKYMMRDFQELGCWNTNVLREIIKDRGSVQNLDNPFTENSEEFERFEFLRKKYKTTFEHSQKLLLQHTADFSRFVDQAASHNAWFKDPDYGQLSTYHFISWEMGLKTGMYYLRQEARDQPENMALESLEIITKGNNSSSFECENCGV